MGVRGGRGERGYFRGRSRAVPVGLLATVLPALLLGGCGAGGRAGGPPALGAPPPPRPAAAPLPDLDPRAPLPDPAAVRRALAATLADPALAGPSAQVVDAQTGEVLVDRRGYAAAPPASTVKTVVAAAALTTLGPATRLRTRVLRSGDSLWLVGGGDPTLTAAPAGGYPGYARLGDLARQVRGAGVTTVRRVVGDGSLFPGPAVAPGWKEAYIEGGNVAPVSALEVDAGRSAPGSRGPRTRAPDAAAAGAFVAALRAAGVRVAAAGTGTAPPGAREVAAVDSPPVPVLVEHMLTASDNDLAEALGRHVARAQGQPATFAGAAATVVQVLRGLGIPAEGATLSDASGLSTRDRIAPATLVALLRAATAREHPELRSVLSGLPVAGFTGTLAERYRQGPARVAAGRVRAKTGSLSTVTSLAGVVVDADGRLVVFAVFAPVADSGASKAAIDRVAAALAGCGCSAPAGPRPGGGKPLPGH